MQHEPSADRENRDRDNPRDNPGRESLRQVHEAGREAVREAREAAREQARQAREELRDTLRQARETRHESLRALREATRRGAGDTGTRARIQQVALELFTEHGYEATSLREIAERLGVTKAALYYHFKTKDEILESMVADRVARVSELIDWAAAQPNTPELRGEILRRYADLLREQSHHQLVRFFERNQSSMGQHRAGDVMKAKMMKMLDLLTDRDAPLTDQIRSSLAIFALHAAGFVIRDPEVSDDARHAAALEVALELIHAP